MKLSALFIRTLRILLKHRKPAIVPLFSHIFIGFFLEVSYRGYARLHFWESSYIDMSRVLLCAAGSCTATGIEGCHWHRGSLSALGRCRGPIALYSIWHGRLGGLVATARKALGGWGRDGMILAVSELVVGLWCPLLGPCLKR